MTNNQFLLMALALYMGSQGAFVALHHREMTRRGYKLSKYWTRYTRD